MVSNVVMADELEKIEEVVVYFKILSQNSPRATEKIQEKSRLCFLPHLFIALQFD
jgi:hypothetical protein